jgi:hypothetical protein
MAATHQQHGSHTPARHALPAWPVTSSLRNTKLPHMHPNHKTSTRMQQQTSGHHLFSGLCSRGWKMDGMHTLTVTYGSIRCPPPCTNQATAHATAAHRT